MPLALTYTVLHELPGITRLSGQALLELSNYVQSLVFIIVILNLAIQGFSLPKFSRWLSFSPAKPD